MPVDDLPRLSAKELSVLEQLVGGEKYGLELVAGSAGYLSRHSVYVLLARMEEKGFIDSREDAAPPGVAVPPRRKYAVTGHGRRVLSASELALAAPRGAR
jgi:PadR family transcriptional regulator